MEVQTHHFFQQNSSDHRSSVALFSFVLKAVKSDTEMHLSPCFLTHKLHLVFVWINLFHHWKLLGEVEVRNAEVPLHEPATKSLLAHVVGVNFTEIEHACREVPRPQVQRSIHFHSVTG